MQPSGACLLGIDIGAGSLKSMVIDDAGRVLGSASKSLVTSQPHHGWTEQDPEDWYNAVKATVPQALAESGIDAGDIRAVSFSAGAHTPVLTDEAGRVLRPAILWSDQRSGAESRELDEAHGAIILETGANRPSPTWTLSQLLWLSRHEPDIRQRTRRLFVAKDYLRYRLTGDWHTDVTDAVGTLLYDVGNEGWSDTLCEFAEWPRETLPPIVAPHAIVGEVSAKAAEECGLRAGTPVVCGSSDTSVEAFGGGAVEEGHATVKLATAGTVSTVLKQPRITRSLINYPFVRPGYWYAITGTNSCASAHRWLRDTFFGQREDGSEFGLMDAAAASAPAGSDGLIFHPYLNGERSPYWDPLLRADFIGMTMRHESRHFVRSLYEGVAFSLRDCREAFREQGLDLGSASVIGGGAHSETWRQIVADVLGLEIRLPACTDASFGAALLAGVGVGVFENPVDAVARTVRVAARHEPNPRNAALYDDLFGIYKTAQARLAEVNHAIHAVVTRHGAA